EVVALVGHLAGIKLLIKITLDRTSPSKRDCVEIPAIQLLLQLWPILRVKLDSHAALGISIFDEEHDPFESSVLVGIGNSYGEGLAIGPDHRAAVFAITSFGKELLGTGRIKWQGSNRRIGLR